MSTLLSILLPEIILVVVACALLLLGVSSKAAARRLAPALALGALAAVVALQMYALVDEPSVRSDRWNTVVATGFTHYIKMLTAAVGGLLVLLAWPTNADATGSRSLQFGGDAGEFFALMLLSLTGVMLVSVANDLVLLFLAVELASIPTYVMVSISRPIPVAQEAGVKYFFLGAMAAAVMLFGFSYIYGTTGLTKLTDIAAALHPPTAGEWAVTPLNTWQLLGVVVLLAGFAFKIAAVPFHAYAGDVYQGAATPVTAFLAFVPKTSGFVAIVKVLGAVCAAGWAVPEEVTKLLWVMAVLTMSFGNVLALSQKVNVKRVLAYSSVAHSGYMLVGLTAMVSAPGNQDVQRAALQGILFYLGAYGLSNVAAFGVLMLLPSRTADPHAAPVPHRLPHARQLHAPSAPA